MAHPVLEQQTAMNGEGYGTAAPRTADEGYVVGSSEWLNKKVPNTLAAMLIGSIATLVILRAAGFRFSFGVNVGGGA